MSLHSLCLKSFSSSLLSTEWSLNFAWPSGLYSVKLVASMQPAGREFDMLDVELNISNLMSYDF